jgi:uncharacterized protein
VKEYIDFSKGPLPDVDLKESVPFWEGTRKGEIRFPRCRSCHRFHWYPTVLCPFCSSADIEWQTLTSQPRVNTWTYVVYPVGIFATIGPRIVALVEFDEAPDCHLATNLVDCKDEEIYVGMPLEVVFQKINDRLTMPLFRPKKDHQS